MLRYDEALPIRSHHGALRDLVPIYSVYQLIPNLVALSVALGIGFSLGHYPKGVLPVAMLVWVFQFVARPSRMEVTQAQAAWLEQGLAEEGFYERNELDGRWRPVGLPWWQRLPHFFIAFRPGPSVTVVAPRDVMESMRAYLDAQTEQRALVPAGDQPFTFEAPEPDPLPWHAHVPTAVLASACVAAAIWYLAGHDSIGMVDWGVSAAGLAHGRFDTVFLHMFAHGSIMHLTMNLSMLAAIGGTLVARLGPAPLNWMRFLLLFLLSGLSGAVLYLALHPTGTVPMVGASGALYGLLGLLIRVSADGDGLVPMNSHKIRRVGWDLAKLNAFLFALLAAMAWASGSAGGLAWEAHLGGFLFGLLLGPKLLPRTAQA